MAFGMLSITPADAQVSGYYDTYGNFVPVILPQPVVQAAPGLGARVNEGYYDQYGRLVRYNSNALSMIAWTLAQLAQQNYVRRVYENGYDSQFQNSLFLPTPSYVPPSLYYGYPPLRNGSTVIIIPVTINKRKGNTY